jgi:hypothetical protein
VTNVHTGWIDLRLVRDGPAMTCAIDLHAFPFSVNPLYCSALLRSSVLFWPSNAHSLGSSYPGQRAKSRYPGLSPTTVTCPLQGATSSS